MTTLDVDLVAPARDRDLGRARVGIWLTDPGTVSLWTRVQ